MIFLVNIRRSAFKDQLAVVKPAIQFYARALMLGCNYVHQALPQLLSLWMELAPAVTPEKPRGSDGSIRRNSSMNSANAALDGSFEEFRSRVFAQVLPSVKLLVQRVPTYVLMVAIAQVVSRLCHKNDDVHEVLSAYIARTLSMYPSQTWWHLASSSNSAERLRSARVKGLLARTISEYPTIEVALNQGIQLSESFITLSDYQTGKEQTSLSVNREAKYFLKLFPSIHCIIPTQVQMQSTLPEDGAHKVPDEYDPFLISKPDRTFMKPVTFHSLVDNVDIMSSLVRPKKITAIGSDGNEYVFLCKPKDDLRKDARLMEVVALINRVLVQNREARERHLSISGYAVTPLNEECGLIEWVPQTTALRVILRQGYRHRYKMEIYNKEVHTLFTASKDQLLPNFKKLLTLYPPVLHSWFAEEFTNPNAWHRARLRFTRSCATMSMVGYILGLGDRHLENILLDVSRGDVVHVDFNCLFDKGKTFAKPEIVPFRLTQNMIAAFGILKVEGPFRKACEVILTLLRDHSEDLMIVLDTFLHDPLIEWKSKKVPLALHFTMFTVCGQISLTELNMKKNKNNNRLYFGGFESTGRKIIKNW
jgi:serine/threonine-protein kinase ATR